MGVHPCAIDAGITTALFWLFRPASMASSVATDDAASPPANTRVHSTHSSESVVTTASPTLSDAASDCGGLCAMICSLLGMACVMVLVLFAISWIRGRTARALFVVSKTVAAAPRWAHRTIPRPKVSLTALSIIRV
jgi:hypothetical protein